MDLQLSIFLSVALLHYSRNSLIPWDHPWTPQANLIFWTALCTLGQWAGCLRSSRCCFPLLSNGLLISPSIPCPSRFSQEINTSLVREAEMEQGRGRAMLPLTNLRVLQGWQRTTKQEQTKSTLEKAGNTCSLQTCRKQTCLRHKPPRETRNPFQRFLTMVWREETEPCPRF